MSQRSRLAALACAAVAAATFAAPSHADPTAIHAMRPHGLVADAAPALSYGSGNLTSHGGPVENGSSNYLIFWGYPDPNLVCQELQCAASSSASVPIAPQVEDLFSDVSDLHLYSLLGQYGVSGRSRLSGTYVDVDVPPGTGTGTLTDAQVKSEIRKVQSLTGWSGGLGRNFWVFTGPGIKECTSFGCSGTDFCGYHGTLSDASGVTTPYAFIPYPVNTQVSCSTLSAPNVVPAVDDTDNIVSHELFEILTDPLLNAWYDGAGYEIADKCVWMFGATDTRGGDTTAPSGTPYHLQKEYSNSVSDCRM